MDKYGRNDLHRAAQRGDLPAYQALLQQYPRMLVQRDIYGYTPPQLATKSIKRHYRIPKQVTFALSCLDPMSCPARPRTASSYSSTRPFHPTNRSSMASNMISTPVEEKSVVYSES
jgi:hypothetical protein